MKLIKNILCLVLIILIFFIFTTCVYSVNEKNQITEIREFINGYWTSDNKFAKVSDIDDMILNIDIENNTGFLIIIIDKEINDSDDFILKIHKLHSKKNKCDPKYNEFEIEFLSDDEDFIWYDKKFKAILSIDDGSLKLFHGDTLYADLFKDNKMTHLLK
jgi:hypothetical protein